MEANGWLSQYAKEKCTSQNILPSVALIRVSLLLLDVIPRMWIRKEEAIRREKSVDDGGAVKIG